MDIELKQHLDAMEGRSVRLVTDLKENLERQVNTLEARSVRLVTDLKESLERQINAWRRTAGRFLATA